MQVVLLHPWGSSASSCGVPLWGCHGVTRNCGVPLGLPWGHRAQGFLGVRSFCTFFKITHLCGDAVSSSSLRKRVMSEYFLTQDVRCFAVWYFYSALISLSWHLPALCGPHLWPVVTLKAWVTQILLMKSTSSYLPFYKNRGKPKQISQLKKMCCWHHKKERHMTNLSDIQTNF